MNFFSRRYGALQILSLFYLLIFVASISFAQSIEPMYKCQDPTGPQFSILIQKSHNIESSLFSYSHPSGNAGLFREQMPHGQQAPQAMNLPLGSSIAVDSFATLDQMGKIQISIQKSFDGALEVLFNLLHLDPISGSYIQRGQGTCEAYNIYFEVNLQPKQDPRNILDSILATPASPHIMDGYFSQDFKNCKNAVKENTDQRLCLACNLAHEAKKYNYLADMLLIGQVTSLRKNFSSQSFIKSYAGESICKTIEKKWMFTWMLRTPYINFFDSPGITKARKALIVTDWVLSQQHIFPPEFKSRCIMHYKNSAETDADWGQMKFVFKEGAHSFYEELRGNLDWCDPIHNAKRSLSNEDLVTYQTNLHLFFQSNNIESKSIEAMLKYSSRD